MLLHRFWSYLTPWMDYGHRPSLVHCSRQLSPDGLQTASQFMPPVASQFSAQERCSLKQPDTHSVHSLAKTRWGRDTITVPASKLHSMATRINTLDIFPPLLLPGSAGSLHSKFQAAARQ